jgi:rSAM/selenodomain-associated transferase 1
VGAVLSQLTGFKSVELRFTPADAGREVQPWLRDGWRASAQGEGDLGERLNNAFADTFAAGAKRVVIIGSDCPYLRAEDIRTTWVELQSCDLVLGPAEDGGYWLIGLREKQPELFANMAWSSSQVSGETIARAKTMGLKTFLLRTLSDVDTREDWERFITLVAAQDRPRHQAPAGD